MRAFQDALEPVADPGEGVEFRPEGQIRRVTDVEQFPELGPVDFGAVVAGDTLEDQEVTQLELRANQLGQFRVHPISPVDIEVAQDGQQDFRYETANQRAVISPATRSNLTTIFVFHDDVPFFNIFNPNSYDLQKTQVAFFGFKMLLSDEPVEAGQVEGEPKPVPVERLEVSTQTRDQGQATQSAPANSAEARRDRINRRGD